MRNRLIYAAVGVVGVLLIGLAVASATLWRADDVLTATATADQAILVTDPGVLEMAGDPVTVTATVPPGDHVVLAVGRDTDVDGWVGTDAHQRVTGLAGWHTLALAAPGSSSSAVPSGASSAASSAASSGGPTSAPATAETPAPGVATPVPSQSATAGATATATPPSTAVPDAAASDMWVSVAQGTGSATMSWPTQPGRWSLLVVGSTAAGAGVPPTLALAWPRTVTTPYLVPGIVVGALLLLVALGLLWRDLRHRHGAEVWTPVATGAIPVVAGADPATQGTLTRRQLREMAELARTGQLPAVRAAGAPMPPTGNVPIVPSGRSDEAVTGAAVGAPSSSAAAGAPPPDEGTAPTAEAGRRGLWRRSGSPTPGPSDPETPSAESSDTAPVPVVDHPDPPVPGGRRARRQAAGVAAVPAVPAVAAEDSVAAPSAGSAAEQGTTTSGDVAPTSPDQSAPSPEEPGWARPDEPSVRPGEPATVRPDEPVGQARSTGPTSSVERPGPAPAATRPTWMPRRQTPVTSEPSSSAPPAASATRAPSAHPAEAQPAWLSRVAARWQQEDAAEAVEAAGGEPAVQASSSQAVTAPSSSGPPGEPGEAGEASEADEPQLPRPAQPEPSRADAWRRAWGLPPLDVEEEDR